MQVKSLQLISVILFASLLGACGGGGTSSTGSDSLTPSNDSSNQISESDVDPDGDSKNDSSDEIDDDAATLSINSQPTARTIASGESISLSLNVSSGSDFTVKWFKDGSEVSQTNTYNLSNITVGDSGTYSCRVLASGATADCNSFTITVLDAPRVSGISGNQIVTEGENVSISVTAEGSDLIYQWYMNGSPIQGATTTELQLSQVQPGDAGDFYCVVSNAVGSDNSNVASLSVLESTTYANVSVSWQPPQSREDGSALAESEISAYRVYFAESNSAYYNEYVEADGGMQSIVIEQLAAGDYKFAVSAVDVNGLESRLSDDFLVAVN